MRRILAFLLCAVLVGAHATPQPYSTGKGRWEFICSDKRLIMVRIIMIEAGEVLLPVPDDPCPNAPPKPSERKSERKT